MELLRRSNKVLDVGAGAGLFLWHARKAGWEVHGVELSSYGPAYAKRHFELSIQQGTLSDVTFVAGSFDVVVMQDVLEHVSDVGETFRIANRLLRAEGAVVVETPNYSGLSRRLLGSDWSAISPAEHLTLLDFRSFRALCKATGFTAERFKRVGHVCWIPNVHDNTRRFTVIRQKALRGLIRYIPKNLGRFIGHYLGDELHVVARKVANS
jgi:2-polyprenyl-3-methyl-5-hydroxy-6-metoxy-1,4-benzoquinol methylase